MRSTNSYPGSLFFGQKVRLSSLPSSKTCRRQNTLGGRSKLFKDVRAHCYCASLVRTLFIGHARATSFSSARTDSKTQQNIERMTFALTWCANIFVGCSVTPTFFFSRSLPFLTLSIILKNKKYCVWEVLIISHILLKKRVELIHGYRCA